MKFVLITDDPQIEEAAVEGLKPYKCQVFSDWKSALDACKGVDLLFVDQVATLKEPHKIEGYEEFALAKMEHSGAAGVKLVLISPPSNYELDFIVGWPDFVFGNIQRPVEAKLFRRASTWI